MTLKYSHIRTITNAETGETVDVSERYRSYSDAVYELAKTPYSIVIQAERLSDGELVYVAKHPEFDTCMAQGDSPAMALLRLEDVRLDVIDYYLENSLELPKPSLYEDA